MFVLRRRLWEIACTLVIMPAVLAVLWNADLVRMALGAFGSAPAVVVQRWLVAGCLLTALGLWRRRAQPMSGQPAWLLGVACLAIVALVVSGMRDRDVQRRNVTFRANGITVTGTLFAPASSRPLPAMVLVPGSPPLKRGFYAIWAEHLVRAGYAVLVADKRGVGGTGGAFEKQDNGSRANLGLLADDVVAAVEFLANQPEVDSTRLGLVGVSQAGWVAPLAATRSPRIRYLALITAPTVSVHEEGVWSDLRGDDQRSATTSRSVAEQVMDTVGSRGFDPRPLLGALDIPGLWLFGDEDNSIPTRKSVAVLDSLRSVAGKDYQADRFADAGHALITRAGGLVPRIEPTSWDRLTSWLRTHSGRSAIPARSPSPPAQASP